MSHEAASLSGTEDWLAPELTELARSHAAVADAIGRMVDAISTGRETFIGIEQLRLQTAVDQYRTWATDIREALEASEEETTELRLRLSRMQSEFREALRSRAAELAVQDVVRFSNKA